MYIFIQQNHKIYIKFPVRFNDFFVGSGVMECAVRSDLRCNESSYGHHAWLSSHRAARAHEEQISHASAIWLSPWSQRPEHDMGTTCLTNFQDAANAPPAPREHALCTRHQRSSVLVKRTLQVVKSTFIRLLSLWFAMFSLF